MDNPQNVNAEDVKRANRSLVITLAVVLAVVAAVAIVGFLCLNRPAEYLQGQVEGTTVRVSGKMPGRVVEFFVQEGDTVHAGDTLVHIHSSVAEAQLAQAEAVQQAAEAQNRKVDAGTRSQIIQTAADLVAQAQAAVEITKKTYARMENLYKQGVVSEQKRDEAKAAYDAAKAQLAAARSQHSLAVAGAQSEDKQTAAAMVAVAGGGVAQVQAIIEDSYLTAPCDGTVDEIYPEPGELVAMGTPLVNILKNSRYVVFNVREEMLPKFKMGSEITVDVPGIGNKSVKLKVYYVRDMGTYAVWRATKTTGQYDRRTFEIKARPVDDNQAAGLRPGMSAIHRE